MRYVSTRQNTPDSVDFEQALLEGLARDGGLFVPERWPTLDRTALDALSGAEYPRVAAACMAGFVGDTFDRASLSTIADASYEEFAHPATAPLVQLAQDIWLLELFHGPTLAFKDFALQMLGRMFDAVLARRGQRLMIVGATSGDTGSAAIEACRGRERLSIVILHPKGRVSDIQRRQMTTVEASNVHNIAIDGTFDDCQALVKAMFNDLAFRDEMGLAAVNSINWARVAAQTAYYVSAALALGAPGRPVSFVVPTGNFGNVYAAYAARGMGLPVRRLVLASNQNDILTRFFETGAYRKHAVHKTLSPSMDIQVASNFERFLFDLCERDGETIRGLMDDLARDGGFAVGEDRMTAAAAVFKAFRADDATCLETIADVRERCGMLIDPHTATGVHAARAAKADDPADGPFICLATAHPAKFPDAVARATGERPTLPPRLTGLMDKPERMTALPAVLDQVKTFVRERAAGNQEMVA